MVRSIPAPLPVPHRSLVVMAQSDQVAAVTTPAMEAVAAVQQRLAEMGTQEMEGTRVPGTMDTGQIFRVPSVRPPRAAWAAAAAAASEAVRRR